MEAIVLKTYPSGEADLVLKVLTATKGTLALIAKHARKSKRRFAGSFDPFDWGIFSVRGGKGGLHYVDSFKRNGSFPGIREDLNRVIIASLICEAYLAIIPENTIENRALFDQLAESLQLVSNEADLKTQLRACYYCLAHLLIDQGIPCSADSRAPSAKNLTTLINEIEHYTERELATKEEIKRLLLTIDRT